MKKILMLMMIAAGAFAFQGCSKGDMDSPSQSPTQGNTGTGGTGTGTGGSMARFTIAKDFLYIIQNDRLEVFSLANAAEPVHSSGMKLQGSEIETIFAFHEYLLMGTRSGMLIYSITNPSQPVYVSTYAHIRRCDPVVAQGNYAYVTLRTGTDCGGTPVNELQVIDISNMSSPSLVNTYPLSNPFGLGVDGNHLFVCDGTDGLKVFDNEDPESLEMTNHITGIETFDVIPYNNLLMVIGPDGLSQYDYSDINYLKLLSTIPVTE
ncbi:MAG: hypothetical protein WD077_06765 [Bacteroidia bacterium]